MIDNSSEMERWHKEKGIEKYNSFLNVSFGDIVFDLGAYKGDWARSLFDKTKARILSFEPVYLFYQEAAEKLGNDTYYFNFALGAKDENLMISLNQDGSSLFKDYPEKMEITVVEICSFLKRISVDKAKLIKINIEGAEYDLLEHMIKNDIIKVFDSFLIQFHSLKDGKEIERKEFINKEMSKTHKKEFDYNFVWEGWLRR